MVSVIKAACSGRAEKKRTCARPCVADDKEKRKAKATRPVVCVIRGEDTETVQRTPRTQSDEDAHAIRREATRRGKQSEEQSEDIGMY